MRPSKSRQAAVRQTWDRLEMPCVTVTTSKYLRQRCGSDTKRDADASEIRFPQSGSCDLTRKRRQNGVIKGAILASNWIAFVVRGFRDGEHSRNATPRSNSQQAETPRSGPRCY